jgi:hypothetical protein
MTSATLLGWQPRTPATYAQPVQVESATAGLCGAEMPDGRGILVWPNGGDAKFAVVSSPARFLTNNVVGSGDIGTITSGSVTRTSVFTIDGGVYAMVDRWQGSGGVWSLKIYSADNPSNPTTWTLAATVLQTNSAGIIFGYTTWGAGIPLKLDSGRWVLCQGGGEVGVPPGGGASGTFAHAFYSDNGAAGPWTRAMSYGHHLSGFPRTTWVSAQVVADPAASGDLYFTSSAQSPNEGLLWRSQNNGVTWTKYNSGWTDSFILSPAIDNGTTAFALGTNDLYTPTGDPTNIKVVAGGWTAHTQWTAPGMSTERDTRKAIIAGGDMYYFVRDQVAKSPGGWFVGFIGQR